MGTGGHRSASKEVIIKRTSYYIGSLASCFLFFLLIFFHPTVTLVRVKGKDHRGRIDRSRVFSFVVCSSPLALLLSLNRQSAGRVLHHFVRRERTTFLIPSAPLHFVSNRRHHECHFNIFGLFAAGTHKPVVTPIFVIQQQTLQTLSSFLSFKI